MKISPKVLADALASVKPAVATRSAIEALSGVRVKASHRDGATLEATNLGFAVEKTLDCISVPPASEALDALVSHADLQKAAKLFGKREAIELESEVGFPNMRSDPEQLCENLEHQQRQRHGVPHGHRVVDYLKLVEAQVLGREQEELVVTDGWRTIRLPMLKRQDWPEIDWNPPGETLVVEANGANLADQIKRVTVCASTDETRPILTGVCIDTNRGRLVATDSYRLMATHIPGDVRAFDKPMNVPAKLLKLAAKAMPKSLARVSFAPEIIQWRVAGEPGIRSEAREADSYAAGFVLIDLPDIGEVWRGRLIEGNFPNYEQLIPDASELVVDMPVRVLNEAADVAIAFAKGNAPAVLGINGRCTLSGSNVDGPSFEEVLEDVSYTVPGTPAMPFEMGFNPEFLRDVAKAASGDRLKLSLITPMRPATFTDGAGDLHLLMPIRLNV